MKYLIVALAASTVSGHTLAVASPRVNPPASTAALIGGTDTCTTPDPIAGSGPFPFDTGSATTGAEGQSNPLCAAGGLTGISQDVWFTWTPMTSGPVLLSICGQSTVNTKAAVYLGASCPTTPAVACNDDLCGVQSQLVFTATSGQPYTIQIGSHPGTPGGGGTFTLTGAIMYQGLPVLPRGQATVTVTGTRLIVANIGSSGQDGVSIDLPPATGCWAAGLVPLDPIALPTGAFLRMTMMGSMGGVPDQITGIEQMTDAGTTFDIMHDWTPAGATSTTYKGYAGCDLVGQLIVPGGMTVATGVARSLNLLEGTTSCFTSCPPPSKENNHPGSFADAVNMVLPTGVLQGITHVAPTAFVPVPPDDYTRTILQAADIGSFTLTSMGAMGGGMSAAPGLVISEVVDGTLTGGQPKFVELTNHGMMPVDLSQYSLANFNNGSTSMGGGVATQLNSVMLPVGGRYILAYELSSNVACDPMGVQTCFAHTYGFAPDQYSGPFINGNDAIVLFKGLAHGDGSDAIVADSYGVIGQDGVGTNWEYTDGYSYRRGLVPVGSFSSGAWHVAGPLSLVDPGGDPAETILIQTVTTPGVATLCPPDTGIAYCFGDGSGTACPCGNNNIAGSMTGCLNSLTTGGKLVANGVAEITHDSFVLHGSGMPNTSTLYFQGNAQVNGGLGTVFGDGLRCSMTSVLRLGTKLNVAGISQYPEGLDFPISIRGQIVVPGSRRQYQAWYRNPAMFCTASTFNLTNGIEIIWGA